MSTYEFRSIKYAQGVSAMISAPPPGMKYVFDPDLLGDLTPDDLEGEEAEDYLMLVDEDNKDFTPFIPED